MGSIRKHGQTGALFFDFRIAGERCREYTVLPDTSANRKKLQKVLDRIESEIAAGTFDYRQFFPTSRQAAKFDPAGDYIARWVPELAALPPAHRHAPWTGGTPPRDYPPPIVDLASSRQAALDALERTRARHTASSDASDRPSPA